MNMLASAVEEPQVQKKKKKVKQGGKKRGHRALVPACKHFAVKNTHDSKSRK
jgi:hypothetical protein